MNRMILRCTGVGVWVAVFVASYLLTVSAGPTSGDASPGVSLANFFSGPVHRVTAVDPTGRLLQHDPVFYQDESGSWSQIGYVSDSATTAGQRVQLAWYTRQVQPSQCKLTFFRNSGRLEDVVATLLPPEKRAQIQQRLAATMQTHGDELSAAFVPLVQQTLRRSLPMIESELRLAVDKRRAEIDRLGERWNDEVVDGRLIPLARQEIIPIVREHGEPPAERIGRELWDRASIWRFGWRAVYDRSPLPRKDLLQEEWDRFVDQEAIPVFESHMDDIVIAVQRIVSDVAANEIVRNELGDVAASLATDSETRRLVREILKETLVENENLQRAWNEIWTSEEARRAFDLAGDRLEPVVRQIGDDIFGTREEGINPDFARVLRNQILGKDRRWIVAEKFDGLEGEDAKVTASPSADPAVHRLPVIAPASGRMPYPIVYLAADRATEDSDE